jgi:flagellar hook-length control protein FliK
MDAIQAVSKTKPQAAPAAAANDDASVAGIFSNLLDAIGAKFKPDNGSLGMDTKLMRGNADADARDAARDRDAAKVREDKHDNRAAKSKETKSRDNDDSDTEETDAAVNEDTKNTDQAATDAPAEQTAAPVVVVPVDVPIVTTDVLAPILVAQQVTEVAAVQQTAAVTTAVAAETAAVATETAAVVDPTAKAVEQIVAAEAPAAVQKAVEVTAQGFKQAVAKAAGPAEATVTELTNTTTTVAADADAAKTKDSAETVVKTQRSAAAQVQSQDLSQKVGPDTKAQVQVSVTNHAGPHTAVVNSVYDIYAGYNNTQAATGNAQVVTDATNALTQDTKTPAETTQAQVASPSPVIAPQSPSSQQGPSSAPTPSAMRADIAAPAASQAGGSHASFGESSFDNAGAGNQSNATNSTSQTAATERPLPPAQQVIDQIKVVINRAAKAGLDKVTIQLKPHELGRVDVQLEMSEDHKVRVTVTADNKDTLALLQNDSRMLERALNDAGLRTDANNLHFSLRSDAEARDSQQGQGGDRNGRADNNGATDESEDIAMTYDYTEIARARGGVDTFA